jgi:DNA modification methylase
MVFTDPPYLLQHYGGGFSRKEIRQDFKDKLAPLASFDPTRFIEQLDILEWSSAIVFTSKDLLPQYMAWAGQYDFNLFIWHKTNPPPFTNNTFLPDLEYLVVAHRPNKIFNNGLGYEPYSRMYSPDIHEGKDAVLASHPTMKPLPIMTRYINVLSNRDGIVLDPFLGSGTTMVACEQTGRVCYGVELDPTYAAVCIHRWETLTGDKAALVSPRLDTSTHEIAF